jgi:3'(2'), 5'-bisphosphate nucleotidase
VPKTDHTFFLVDPLDGTREFIHKRPEFTVNIGLVQGGRPVFGVVYAPASGLLFATIGAGVAAEAIMPVEMDEAGLASLAWTPIRAREPNGGALVALESFSHRSPETSDVLARYRISETRCAGSSLKFCLIARGDADLYPRIGPTCEWDTAAAHAVLAAAGGSVLTLDGAPLAYGKAPRYLNPHFIAWGARPIVAS